MNRNQVVAGALLATSLVLTGCSTKADDSSSQGSADGVKTDVGVTDDTITLGVQSDLTGVFKTVGLGLTHGNELWATDINASGGVCGRTIELNIQDNNYKAENAVPLYDQQKSSVVAFAQLLGAHVYAALKQKLVTDGMLAIPATQSSIILDTPSALVIGATYDIEMINGLAYLAESGGLDDGDRLGHIYVDSEYGQNGLLGAQYFAVEHGIDLIEVPVSASDSDMTVTIAKLKSAGVDAIALSTTPAGTASAAIQNQAQGLNAPMVGNNPTVDAKMMSDPQVANALSDYVVSAATAAYAHDVPLGQQIQSAYDAKYSDPPTFAVNAGYLEGLTMQAVLEQACSDGDLTQQGLVDARAKVTAVSGEGLSGDMDLSHPGAPTTRATFIEKPDPSILDQGGLVVVDDLYESDDANSYQAPFES